MASLSPAPLLAATMLVMLGLSHSTLIQTPLQSVSLPTSSIRGYRPLPGEQREYGTRPWWSHTRRLDGRLRSSYAPKTTLVTKTPPSSGSSSYGPRASEGSLSRVFGYRPAASRSSRPSKTRFLQRLKSGERLGPDDRQRLRSSLLYTLAKYRELERESDYQHEEEADARVSVYDRENYNNLYDAFYENVMSEILSDEFNYLLDEASLRQSGRDDRDQVEKQLALVYPALLEYLTVHSPFKNKIPSSFPPKFIAHVHAKLAELENSMSSRELENTNFGPFPVWEDNFDGRVQHNKDLSIFPGQDQINSVYDTDDYVQTNSNRDPSQAEASSKMQQPQKPTVDAGPSNTDFIADLGNERTLDAHRQRISEEEIKTSSTKLLETPEEPVRKDETTFFKLKDLVKGPIRNKDQQSLNGRNRRSVTEKEEAALHAEECHAHNLRGCGQPAMKKLMKATDMKTKCRVREEFLNCMGEKRFQPCLPSASTSAGDPKGNKLHPLEDPLLRDLRKSLRKGLATTCIFGYSRAENATLDI